MGTYDCIVVGAGISGLSTAYALQRRGAKVLVVEASAKVGGAMSSEQTPEGFVLEKGPNTIVCGSADMHEHFANLGIEKELMQADRQGARRYLLLDGQLELIPMGPVGAITTRLFSPKGKLRLAAEPFIPRAKTSDESVATFFTRRLGTELAQRVVDPFVSGVYAGDATVLSIRETFPVVWEAEQKYGNIVWGMINIMREKAAERKKTGKKRVKSEMISFRGGVAHWPQAIAKALGPNNVWLNCPATALQRVEQDWQLTVQHDGKEETVSAERLILATPAGATANLLEPLDPKVAKALREIPYPSVAVVHLGYRREDVAHPLDGFGMLCPSHEKRDVLGTLWSSTLFTENAPQGKVLLTSFVGGARRSAFALQAEDSLLEAIIQEQQKLVGAKGQPVFTRITQWQSAIPQYVAGHTERMAQVNRLEAMWSGLYIVSNYRDGVSVEKCWHKGNELGQRIPFSKPAS